MADRNSEIMAGHNPHSFGRGFSVPSVASSLRGFVALFTMALLLAGCVNDIGTGGTGEWVVPKQTLRQVQATEMSGLATTRPTTGPSTMPATQPAAEIQLSVEEVRVAALANNLDLKVDLLNPTIAKQSLSEEQAKFESLFKTSVNYAKTDRPTASELVGTQTEDLRVDPGVTVPLQTGGTATLDVPMDRFATNNSFATLNPSYTSDVTASLSQPLLRGAGIDVNANSIRVAFYNYQASEARTKLEVIRVLAEADRVYWRLYAARQERDVRKKEYELAVAQLDRARRQVAAGAAAEVEVIRAESGVADKFEAIIIAENTLRQRQRELKRLLNRSDLPMDSPTILVPASKPNPVHYVLDPPQLIEAAMRQRMELLNIELQIAIEASNVRFARNAMLPLVVLDYTYNLNGLGPHWESSISMLRNNEFVDHSVGLKLEVPLGNEAARSRLRAALARRMQQIATKEQQMATIEQEVLNAVEQLETNYQRILAAQKRVIMAARVLDAEIRQFTQGLRTSTDVLIADTNLANARLSEISALTDYQIAQIDIAFATGMVLGAAHVHWQPVAAPKP